MSFAFTASTRELLEQLVRDPRFRPLTTIPVLAMPEIGLILLAFTLFAAASAGYLHGVLPWPAMLLVNATAIYFSFTPLHDATHRSLSGNRTVNDLLGTISCLLLIPGVTTRVYRYLHLEHHRYTGSPQRDPDEIMVSAPAWQLPFVLSCIDLVWFRWYVARWRQRPADERRAFVASFGAYALLHVVFLASPWWREFLLVWLIPQRCGLFTVAFLFAHIQHPKGLSWEETPFQATVRLTVPRLTRLLLLGQAKHFIHHLMPSLPFYRYHRAWDLGRHLLEGQNIPTRSLFTPSRDIILPQRRGDAATWLRARVANVAQVAIDICAYDLVPAEGGSWPAFAAGAHIDVEIAPGLVRQYSLCGPPDERDCYRIAVKREAAGRGGSQRLHERLSPGELVNISAPRNHFPLLGGARHHVLVAGGIGLTPLLAMAAELRDRGGSFALHVFAHSDGHIPFAATLSAQFGDRVQIHLGRAGAGDVVPPYRPGDALQVCGPAGFTATVIEGATARGWPAAMIATESFKPRVLTGTENRPFEVELKRSGRVLQVPAERSLLEILQEAGCPIICACTQGICGSCLSPVVDGEPEHRDVILSDAERATNTLMTVCVSRARSSRLVLDL